MTRRRVSLAPSDGRGVLSAMTGDGRPFLTHLELFALFLGIDRTTPNKMKKYESPPPGQGPKGR